MSRPQKPLRLRHRKDTQTYEIVGPHPRTGKQLRVQTGERDTESAKVYLDRFLSGIDASSHSPVNYDPSLTDLLEAFWQATREQVASPGTRLQNINHFKRHIGGVRPWQISSKTLERYRDLRRTDQWSRPYTNEVKVGVADSTIRREVADLRKAINWAADNDMAWFMGKGKPSFEHPVKADENANPQWLTKKDVRKIVSQAAYHCQVFIEIAVKTAARNGAILELTWDQVDLEKGYIDFGESVGKKRRPKQAMSETLISVLKKAKSLKCTDYVIENNGEPIKSIDTAFESAVIRAGFTDGVYKNGEPRPKYTIHMLKHTAITWMLEDGMAHEEVAKFTNTTVDMIIKVYGHNDLKIAHKAHGATDF